MKYYTKQSPLHRFCGQRGLFFKSIVYWKHHTAKQEAYAKLPKGFHIPTPVGNYSPDWAIAFYEGTVKHIFFVAETKGTMETLQLKPIEQAKIRCARKLFNELSTSKVRYHDVDSYQHLLDVMKTI